MINSLRSENITKNTEIDGLFSKIYDLERKDKSK